MTTVATITGDNRVHLSVQDAWRLSQTTLLRIGYTEENARIVSDHLIAAALCGYEYSGLPKILEIAESAKARQPTSPMQVLKETSVSALLDGGNHVGMVALDHATNTVIEKALVHGFGLVGVTNSWMSGRGAYYVEKIARAGLMAIHTVSSASLVAPHGGAKASMGTNPISFGFPGDPNPLIIDMGTSAFMATELGLYRRRGKLLPEGVAIDRDGQPTRDPEEARLGALLSLAGHKGFALSMAMKAFGILAGSHLNEAKDYGYLLIAFKPDLLITLDEYKAALADMIKRVKATPRLPSVDEIRIPSENSFRNFEINRNAGISIDDHIYRSLLTLNPPRVAG
jgi:LDH2 family malate/lactate/ureidoglycolate dehydrogenase